MATSTTRRRQAFSPLRSVRKASVAHMDYIERQLAASMRGMDK